MSKVVHPLQSKELVSVRQGDEDGPCNRIRPDVPLAVPRS